ncbi:hypothetical protein HF086_000360 [Spodoptera exigua]|uniref:Peptidase aspartic putative domain-containing protein n=1 Tax=Spodoptera exigua TaxID=7107 RepID=A0A922MAX9_SPOEX|nr:hypothetical protein HF086_000360 [Spodoptera exigua]
MIGESATDIKKLLNTTSDCLESIKNLDIDLGSILIIHIITEKLDKVTRRAWELKSVTSLLPFAKVARLEWVDLNDDDLADPEYFIPNRIDVLLGAEVYSQVIQHGVKKNTNGTLLAQETTLGWVLSRLVTNLIREAEATTGRDNQIDQTTNEGNYERGDIWKHYHKKMQNIRPAGTDCSGLL